MVRNSPTSHHYHEARALLARSIARHAEQPTVRLTRTIGTAMDSTRAPETMPDCDLCLLFAAMIVPAQFSIYDGLAAFNICASHLRLVEYGASAIRAFESQLGITDDDHISVLTEGVAT